MEEANKFWEAINGWRQSENLKVKEYHILLECYRRAHMFKKGNYKAKMIYLAMPSVAKPAVQKGYLIPTSEESRGCLSWYNLTKKGVKCLNNLEAKWELKWNLPLFESRHQYC